MVPKIRITPALTSSPAGFLCFFYLGFASLIRNASHLNSNHRMGLAHKQAAKIANGIFPPDDHV
jgi:hypothetical protein